MPFLCRRKESLGERDSADLPQISFKISYLSDYRCNEAHSFHNSLLIFRAQAFIGPGIFLLIPRIFAYACTHTSQDIS